MKTRSFFFVAIISIISFQNGFAQKFKPLNINATPELKTDIAGSYPTEVWEYSWIVEYWSISQQKYISYTSFGEPQEITIIGQAGDTRTKFTYNSNQELTQTLEQQKQGESWIDNRREVLEYDGDGNVTTQLVESWNGAEWVLNYGTQYIYTMEDGEMIGVLTKIWSRDDNEWINSNRSTTSISLDGSVFETMSEEWEDGLWIKSSLVRIEFIDGRISEMIMSGWEDGAWVASTKMSYEYRDYDSNTMTVYTGTEGNWTQSQRFREDFDSHGNTTFYSVEIFAGDWMMLSGSQYDLTYDGDNLVERITQSYSMGEPGTKGATFGGSWKNVWKEEFKDFASLSIGPIVIEGESIDHYPNPAVENVSLKINNLQDKNLTITVIDISGKTLLEEKVYVPSDKFIHVINLDKVPVGTFIIQAREASGKIVSSSRLVHQQ